jgi:hypothetical protein
MNGLKIQICSDVDYENLIAEIYCDDKFIGLISQENAIGEFMVEFPKAIPPVSYEWLLNALQAAKLELSGQ